MKVSLIQMTSGPDPEVNLKALEPLLAEARRNAAQLAVLPEVLLTYGDSAPDLDAIREKYLPRLAKLAEHYRLWLVAGTVPFSPDGAKPFASCFVFDSSGRQCGRYDKIHLFDAQVEDSTGQYRESDYYRAGQAPVLVDTPWGRLGLAVCYDLRFPEYFRLLARKGADFVCVPSAFTRVTGEAHWQVLSRARAIENQYFLLAANQCGQHPGGRETWGHSLAVNPWGEILSEMEETPGCVTVELDLAYLHKLRAGMPVLKHRVFFEDENTES